VTVGEFVVAACVLCEGSVVVGKSVVSVGESVVDTMTVIVTGE